MFVQGARSLRSRRRVGAGPSLRCRIEINAELVLSCAGGGHLGGGFTPVPPHLFRDIAILRSPEALAFSVKDVLDNRILVGRRGDGKRYQVAILFNQYVEIQ